MAAKPPTPSRSSSREEILDAAEEVFAARGYAGASMRAIADGAGVAQALLHYHFKTKEGLFEAMFLRRAGAINRIRIARLDAMLSRGRPSVEDIIEALLRPAVETGDAPMQGGARFAALILELSTADAAWQRDLMARAYDAMATRFIAALMTALPGLDRAGATWGYLFVVGAALTQMPSTGRAHRLSRGATEDADTDAMITRAIIFAAAGLRALAVPMPDHFES
ncbi:TetR/AcrR family transcriptional regulator [Phreatobacter sp.]|uniref:TetR/AcrR family transcriptional regulator n=1 Tax=Phreatobacter sp. TaxID=1966341 RepID=UPI0022C52D18|nr:TetR/AcrR family transcriptional regulator [Phreatobacter sp.]MCZ8316521.1 TetR/AcrR family transcriptional regulator [Phreatobacter sp.]